ncbi:MAG: lipase [Lachnospiraceae bacterium]|nr:lipase [Lachnospiraceae bacterium]
MKTIACLGDSNTFGYDPQSLWGDRYAKEIRWTGRLEAAGFRVHNFGMNGLGLSRTSVFPVLVHEAADVSPDLVTVMLGTNDLLMGISAKETVRLMKGLLSLLLERFEVGQVLLIAPPVLRPGTWVQGEGVIRESERLREEYRRLAEEKEICYVDVGAWDVPLAYDGVHFTEKGHRSFAEKILQSIS